MRHGRSSASTSRRLTSREDHRLDGASSVPSNQCPHAHVPSGATITGKGVPTVHEWRSSSQLVRHFDLVGRGRWTALGLVSQRVAGSKCVSCGPTAHQSPVGASLRDG